jgi:hypothetical protein
MAEFGCVERLDAGDLASLGLDTMSELVAIGADRQGVRSLAVFAGTSSRRLQSPFDVTPFVSGKVGRVMPVSFARAAGPSGTKLGVLLGRGQGPSLAVGPGATALPQLLLFDVTGDAVLGAQPAVLELSSVPVDACDASLVAYDVGGDGVRELLLLGRRAGGIGSSLDDGGDRLVLQPIALDGSLSPPPDPTTWPAFPGGEDGLSAVTSAVDRNLCESFFGRGFSLNGAPDAFGRVRVGEVAGDPTKEDLVLISFASGGSANLPATTTLTLFVDGDVSKPIPVVLPDAFHAVTFALVDRWRTGVSELVIGRDGGAAFGRIELAEDRSAAMLVATGSTPILDAAQGAVSDAALLVFDSVVGDFDGNGIEDVAFAGSGSVRMFLGEAVNGGLQP